MYKIEKPYILSVAEIIYQEIVKIKKKNPEYSNNQAISHTLFTYLFQKKKFDSADYFGAANQQIQQQQIDNQSAAMQDVEEQKGE